MVSDNFVLRSGKHAGKTVGLVRKIDKGYLEWIEINQPKMLEDSKSKQRPVEQIIQKTREERIESRVYPDSLDESEKKNVLTPNLSFLQQTDKNVGS